MGWSALGRIPVLLVVVTLVLLALPALPVMAGGMDLGGTLHVEWRPDPLTLRPGEMGTVHMEVWNDADHRVNVSLQYLTVRSPGASEGSITPDFLELPPGGTQDVAVRIRSHASFGQSEGLSDGHVQVRWGRNLTRDGGGADAQAWDGQDRIVLRVRDDLSRSTTICGVSALIVLATIVVVAYMLMRRRSGPAGPARAPPQGRDAP